MFLARVVETSGVREAWQLIIRSWSGSFRSSITVIHRRGRNAFNILERHFRWGLLQDSHTAVQKFGVNIIFNVIKYKTFCNILLSF